MSKKELLEHLNELINRDDNIVNLKEELLKYNNRLTIGTIESKGEHVISTILQTSDNTIISHEIPPEYLEEETFDINEVYKLLQELYFDILYNKS